MNCEVAENKDKVAIRLEGSTTPSEASATSSTAESSNTSLKQVFKNAVNKNKIIHKIQVLQEEKDHVEEMELNKAHEGALHFKERFQRSRPNSFCDPVEMVPACDVPFLTETPASPKKLSSTPQGGSSDKQQPAAANVSTRGAMAVGMLAPPNVDSVLVEERIERIVNQERVAMEQDLSNTKSNPILEVMEIDSK